MKNRSSRVPAAVSALTALVAACATTEYSVGRQASELECERACARQLLTVDQRRQCVEDCLASGEAPALPAHRSPAPAPLPVAPARPVVPARPEASASSPSTAPVEPEIAPTEVSFVDCLNAHGVQFYHATWCGACKAQRKLLSRVLGESEANRLRIVFDDDGDTELESQIVGVDGRILLPSVFVPPDTVLRGHDENIIPQLSSATGCRPPSL